MISEPEPTEVMPTMRPPMAPIATVLALCTWIGRWTPSPGRAARAGARSSSALKTIMATATSRATPSEILTVSCTVLPLPTARKSSTPQKADGTEPMTSQRTSSL